MNTIQIAANPVTAKILNADDDLKLQISDLLSYKVAGAEHMAAFQDHSWNGRSTMFSYEKATFPAGLLTFVYSHLRQLGMRVQLIRKPAPAPLGAAVPIVNEFGWTQEYAYQYETVDNLTKHWAMIARVATGGGKSNIASIAFARIKRPTLFITTRTVLMYQMRAAFEASIAYRTAHGEPELAGVKVGVMGDGLFAPRRMINVAMVQTIAAKLADRDPAVVARMKEVLAMFELVILEEAHESSGNEYFQILNLCKNAAYRLALTATPFMRDDEEANMRLMAVSGPIGIEVSEQDLIEKGILARPHFRIVNAPPNPLVRKGSGWQRAYNYGIVHNELRNKLVCKEAANLARRGLSSIALVQRKEHGMILRDMLAAAGLRTRFIFGETEQEQRTVALRALGEGKIDTLIGSTILDVGVDVPAVGGLILAGGGKAEVAHRQRIGRVLRRKPKGVPNHAFVVDFRDTGNKHLDAHSQQRLHIVQSTPGFAEGILPPGRNFDFAALGFYE